jgi:hypothetical protein
MKSACRRWGEPVLYMVFQTFMEHDVFPAALRLAEDQRKTHWPVLELANSRATNFRVDDNTWLSDDRFESTHNAS